MRPRTMLMLLLLLCFCFGSQVAHAQLLQLLDHSRFKPMPDAKSWGKIATKDLIFPLHYHSRIKPTYLLIGRDHPNGVRFLAMFPESAIPLPLKFDNFDGFDETGELRRGYSVQVAEHDFDHDGEPEIIIAIGDGSIDLSINIISYHAPQYAKDANRQANWTLVGSYWGQKHGWIEGNTIQLPFGSQGLFNEYTWVKGRFIKTN